MYRTGAGTLLDTVGTIFRSPLKTTELSVHLGADHSSMASVPPANTPKQL